MDKLTQERLKEVLHYDPETGRFTWKMQRHNYVNIGDQAGSVNGMYGYRRIRIDQRVYRAARLAYLYMTGSFPIGYMDHINHCRDDDRWINLRCVSPKENAKNSSMMSFNKSGINGVSWEKRHRRWRAVIYVDRKHIYLGEYQSIEEAQQARKMAEVKYGFHRNHGMSAA